MSVRNVYQVLVDGNVVFSGSYAMACAVYESYEKWRDSALPDVYVPDVIVAFKPK